MYVCGSNKGVHQQKKVETFGNAISSGSLQASHLSWKTSGVSDNVMMVLDEGLLIRSRERVGD